MELIGERANCRVGDLVRTVAISVGTASKTVDRLEAAGWCARIVDPGDRRSSFLELTASGRALLVEAEPLMSAELTRHLRTSLAAKELPALADQLHRLAASLENAVVGVPGLPEQRATDV